MAIDAWNSAASSDWTAAGSWTPAAPTASDTAAISLAGSYAISIAASENITIDSLEMSTADLIVAGELMLNDGEALSTIGPGATIDGLGESGNYSSIVDHGTLANQGTLRATTSGAELAINAATFANTGVIVASGGASVQITSLDFENIAAGTLAAGTYIAVGQTSSNYGSEVYIDNDGSLAATIVSDAATITLSGAGSDFWQYTPSAGYSDLAATLATIDATGVLNVLGGDSYRASKTLTDQGVLTLGGGLLSATALTIAAGGTLLGFGTVSAGAVDAGRIEAQGGTLSFSGGISGQGTLAIDAGAAVVVTGTVQGPVADSGTVILGKGYLQIAGAVTGLGGIVLGAGSVSGGATLDIAGPDAATIAFAGTNALVRLDAPSRFTGTIADLFVGDTIDLPGLVANAATLVGNILDVTNNGTLVTSIPLAGGGSGWDYNAAADGAGGTSLTAAPIATWSAPISADWNAAGGWTPAAPGTLTAAFVTTPGSYAISLAGTENINIDSLEMSTADLIVTGELTLNDAKASSTIGPGATIDRGTISGDGWGIYDYGTLANQGTLRAASSGTELAIYAATFGNTGAIVASGGASVAVTSLDFQNITAGTLTAGTYIAIGQTSSYTGSDIYLYNDGSLASTIVSDAATITLSGAGSELEQESPSSGYSVLQATLATIDATGVLNVLGGNNYLASTTLTDQGLLTLGGGTLGASGLVVGAAGKLVGFGIILPVISDSGVVEAQGGTLTLYGGITGPGSLAIDPAAAVVVTGTVQSAVIDNGIVIVGSGDLDISGTVVGDGGFVVGAGSVSGGYPGITSVSGGATLEVAGPDTAGITFSGTNSLVRLEAPSRFSGTIADLFVGDTIDLPGLVANAATLVGNILDVTNNGSLVISVPLTGGGSGWAYIAAGDGAGGTSLTATPIATWSAPVSADWDAAGSWTPAAPGSLTAAFVSVPGSYTISIASTESIDIDSLEMSTADLIIAGELTLNDGKALSTIGPGAIIDRGTVSSNEWAIYDFGTLANRGTLRAAISGTELAIYAATFGNIGAIVASGGAAVAVTSLDFQNITAGTLTAGTYIAVGQTSPIFYGSDIDFYNDGSLASTIVSDAATITLSGADSEFEQDSQSAGYSDLEATLATIAQTGVLNVLADRGYAAKTALADAGLLTLGGGTLSAVALTIAAGGTLIGFGTVSTSIADAGRVEALGGTLALDGGITGQGTLVIDTGAVVVVSGSLAGTVIDDGTVAVTSGVLEVSGNVTGAGGFLLEGGSVSSRTTLEVAGTSSAGITFSGDFAVARLVAAHGFTGTIADFGGGDTVDLAGIAANGATLVGDTLEVTSNGTTVAGLALADVPAGVTYAASPDGSGGTAIKASGPGLVINYVYDSSVASAPAQFEQALTVVADDLAQIILNPITVNIEVGWGEDAGFGIGGDELATGGRHRRRQPARIGPNRRRWYLSFIRAGESLGIAACLWHGGRWQHRFCHGLRF